MTSLIVDDCQLFIFVTYDQGLHNAVYSCTCAGIYFVPPPFLILYCLLAVEVEEFNKDSALKLYQEVFESPFLRDAGEYYRQEASKLVAELSCSEYMAQVVSRLQAARRSGHKFLHQTSITKVYMH